MPPREPISRPAERANATSGLTPMARMTCEGKARGSKLTRSAGMDLPLSVLTLSLFSGACLTCRQSFRGGVRVDSKPASPSPKTRSMPAFRSAAWMGTGVSTVEQKQEGGGRGGGLTRELAIEGRHDLLEISPSKPSATCGVFSTMVTLRPRARRFSAISRPMKPPPTTQTLAARWLAIQSRTRRVSGMVRMAKMPGRSIPGTGGRMGEAPGARIRAS
jgi:hypothetical protein